MAQFPMDGQPDTCIGFRREMHGTADDTRQGLCAECDARLTAEVRESRMPVRTVRADCAVCLGGAVPHEHARAYYTCLCCYGD